MFLRQALEDSKKDKESIRKIQEACHRGEISEQEMSERMDTIMDNARRRFMQMMDNQSQLNYKMYASPRNHK